MHELIMKVFELFERMGYLGIVLGLMIEIIPSEIVLSYAGFLVASERITYWGAVAAGVVGGIFAQLLLYYLAKWLGRPFIMKYGKYIFIHEKHIVMAEKWFETYGKGVVFFGRFIPVVRHAISIPAGLVKMNVWQFILWTGLAAIPWSMLFISLGMKLGANWENIKEIAAPYTMPIIVGTVACGVIYVLIARAKKKSKQKEGV